MTTKSMSTYSYELKKKAVELYLEGHPAVKIAEENGIKNRRRITEWVEIVRKTGDYSSLHSRRGHANAGKERVHEMTHEEENARLRLEIHYLKKLMELKAR